MGPAIAHLFLSFGFGEDHLAISIEVRKERTEQYSSVAGFFRQYELFYVAADERDVIRVRTNYRKSPPEDVYLFRVVGPIENGRRVFLGYMRDINELRTRPRFYNTLTTNCTTMILTHASVNPGHIPYSWKILVSGYAPEYVYDGGRLGRSLPFAADRRRGRPCPRSRCRSAWTPASADRPCGSLCPHDESLLPAYRGAPAACASAGGAGPSRSRAPARGRWRSARCKPLGPLPKRPSRNSLDDELDV
jgi:Domain of unknown function (DUF4105)